MLKVRVRKGMPDGFFAFYGKPRDEGKRYKEGDTFTIHDETAFSCNYMELVDEPTDKFKEMFDIINDNGEIIYKKKSPDKNTKRGRPAKV